MSLASRIFSTLLLLSLIPVGAAYADCGTEDYYSELVVEPAKIEYRKIKKHIVATPAVYRERVHPAVSKAMTREEYQQLPEMLTYKREVEVAPVFGLGPVLNYDIDNIADFDFVEYPNGQIVRRPLKTSILASYAEDRDIILVSPWRKDWVEETVLRPEPVELANGRLQVVIIPAHAITQEFSESQVMRESEMRYIKSRTPAVIKLTPCQKR